MAITNDFGLSSLQKLKSGRGWWAASGQIQASTNNKPVIDILNVGQLDSIVTISFGGAAENSDINLGNKSLIECYVDDSILYSFTVNSLDGGNPHQTEFSLFIPANTSFRLDITDLDATGKHTTLVKGYYV
jgi:hypothetical protein